MPLAFGVDVGVGDVAAAVDCGVGTASRAAWDDGEEWGSVETGAEGLALASGVAAELGVAVRVGDVVG